MSFDPRSLDASLRDVEDASVSRVEDATLNAAQPTEQLLLDGWLLRFSPGKARRARSVNAIAPGRLPLPQKLALCRDWYRRAHLPLLFRVTPFSQPAGLDDFLATQGFEAFDDTRVMLRPLDAKAAETSGRPAAIRVLPVDIDGFAKQVGVLRGSPDSQVRAHALRMHAMPPQILAVRLMLIEGGEAVAAGQVLMEGECAGLYDLITAKLVRGRGYGRCLSRALVAAAAIRGARIAYLQVDAANLAARRIYAGLGFVDRYAYWYRWPAGSSDRVPSPESLQEQSG